MKKVYFLKNGYFFQKFCKSTNKKNLNNQRQKKLDYNFLKEKYKN